MIPARQIFESFAGLPAGTMPDDPIDALQVRLAAWEAGQPFHVVSDLPVALGIGEECGELADAETTEEEIDAVGDVAIYVCQVATRNRLAMRWILDAPSSKKKHRDPWHRDPWRNLVSALGRVKHLVLKRSQRIREGLLPVEEYRELLATALADVTFAVERAAGRRAEDAFLDTASRILARDWNADRAQGGEVAP